MYIPSDYREIEIQWRGENKGSCGPTSIAVVLGTDVREVINDWEGGYEGYAPFKKVESELKKGDLFVKRISAKKFNRPNQLFLPDDVDNAVARIQWDGEYTHWAEATKNTHYVTLQRINGVVCCFCNSIGEFREGDIEFTNYFINSMGSITSFISII